MKRSTLLSLVVAALLGAVGALGAVPLQTLRVGPDITAPLGSPSITVPGGRLATDNLTGILTLLTLPNLPSEAKINAAHRMDNGDYLLAFDSAVMLPGGGGLAEARDVVQYNSGPQTYMVLVRGADMGVPDGIAIDALAQAPLGTVLLSLDGSTSNPQDLNTLGFGDEDVLVLNFGTALFLYSDGSDAGIPEALDLDALDVRVNGNGDTVLFLSLDGSGEILGLDFDDEDVLEHNLSNGTWDMAYDASALADWPGEADLVALDVSLVPSPTRPSTHTATPRVTATPTLTPVNTSTATATRTGTVAASATTTATATATATIPPDATSTATPFASSTATAESTPTATATETPDIGPGCTGDCNHNRAVTIDELIVMVNIGLGNAAVTACPPGDANRDGAVNIAEIVAAVGAAINGCPP
jgi:hypothetical protein